MDNIRYWTFKHKPGEKANEDKCKELILQAVRNNYVFMQYEYGFEDTRKVTQNWNRVRKVSEGDVIFLRGDKNIYAYGYAIRPRLEADIKLKMQDIIDNKDHGEYNSSDFCGIIHFEDSDVFYENLDGEENWGQRIDVDSWRLYYENGIPAQSQDLYQQGENEYGVLKELKPEKGKEIINELYNYLGMKGDVLSLLKTNHNLILTGAPGTGKTYLAKQVARLLLFGKTNENELNDVERKQFNEQCGFAQFHPSYDYTDFVEGLRPKQYNGNVGFELKDGVFKEFCAKAIRNFEDSKKTQQVLIAQQSFADKYNVIINKINDGSITEFDLKTKGTMEVVDVSNRNSIILRFAGTTTNRTYTVSFKRISILSESFPDVASLDKMNNIYDSIQGVIKGCNASAYWAVLKEIYKQSEQESSQRNEKKELQQEVKEKPYVFIIDEINRGEISKIFGELFFSIDPGYRGTDGKVCTQYANMQKEEANDFDDALGITDPENYGHFFVPENVYIIGTMNDIDRSVESMDFAFRRRFAFKEIKATDRVEMLDDLTWKDEAVKRMNRLNAKIEIIEGLSSAYHIGPAYFLKLKNYNGDFDQLWENHLEGLLREYLRGMQNLEEKLKTLKAAYDNESDSNSGQQQE